MNHAARHAGHLPAHPAGHLAAHPAGHDHARHAGHHAIHHAPQSAATHHAATHSAHLAPTASAPAGATGPSLNRTAWLATLHCLSGCAVGEVLGMVIGTALGLSNGMTIGLAVLLAFAFGYAFTMFPLLRSGMPLRQAARLALLADTASIAVMELVDNLVMLAVPGAMDAPLSSPLFWSALAFALMVAAAAAFPLNRWLIARGRGHAAVHAHHGHHGHH